MEMIFLVLAQWEFEGCEEIVAFRKKERAEMFVRNCEEYQETEPDDFSPAWQANHPATPYLDQGAHMSGVESFGIREIMVI